MTFAFTLPIEPVAWGRVKTGWHGKSFVPTKTRRFERDVARLARQYAPPEPMKGPLGIELTFVLRAPKRWVRELPCVKPDGDNFQKAVLDAFNGLFWVDDGQLVDIRSRKIYAANGSAPEVRVEIFTPPKDRSGSTISRCPECGVGFIEMGEPCGACRLLKQVVIPRRGSE